jgi:hypothetical protein
LEPKKKVSAWVDVGFLRYRASEGMGSALFGEAPEDAGPALRRPATSHPVPREASRQFVPLPACGADFAKGDGRKNG